MIKKAAEFAAMAHKGTMRKGSQIPYIYHPMEVAVIVAQLTSDPEVIAAAYLHDVLEDTQTTPEELEAVFGRRILELVQTETEDKSLTWRERKAATIQRLAEAPLETKILALGDKLSNMRDTARDYLVMRDAVWLRFHEKDREQHRWYLAGILKGLRQLEHTRPYQELSELYELVYQN